MPKPIEFQIVPFFFFFFVPGQSSEILHRKPKIQLLARRKWNFISVVAAYILSGRVYRKSAGDQEFPVEKMLWPKWKRLQTFADQSTRGSCHTVAAKSIGTLLYLL